MIPPNDQETSLAVGTNSERDGFDVQAMLHGSPAISFCQPPTPVKNLQNPLPLLAILCRKWLIRKRQRHAPKGYARVPSLGSPPGWSDNDQQSLKVEGCSGLFQLACGFLAGKQLGLLTQGHVWPQTPLLSEPTDSPLPRLIPSTLVQGWFLPPIRIVPDST